MRLSRMNVNAAPTQLAALGRFNSLSFKVIRLDPRQGVLLGMIGDEGGVGGQWACCGVVVRSVRRGR